MIAEASVKYTLSASIVSRLIIIKMKVSLAQDYFKLVQSIQAAVFFEMHQILKPDMVGSLGWPKSCLNVGVLVHLVSKYISLQLGVGHCSI